MYRIRITDEKNAYELTELAKMFTSADSLDISLVSSDAEAADLIIPGQDEMDRNAQKRVLFSFLAEKTGTAPEWGTLTGVRPEKLFTRTAADLGSADKAEQKLKEDYLVADTKLSLLRETYEVQQGVKRDMDPHAVGLYVGIPFCPTRCLYCSFTSNRFTEKAASAYLEALFKEIDDVKDIMDSKGLYAESVYIGGGTPSSLTDSMFHDMVCRVSDAFVRPKTAEFTVECGRPDTITESKMNSLKTANAGRVSINPQTMKASTLQLIGRQHSPEQIREAFGIARSCGIGCINMDLIAGLPEETASDMEDTLEQIIGMGPENITVHTLAVKRGSRLIEEDKDFAFRQAETVGNMLDIARNKLGKAGYRPYYLYRQKHMAGNHENTGYCLPGTENLYNMRIMDEDQSIIALGAGGISKVYYPAEDRLERVANVSNYEIYIDRIDEMIERKVKGL